MALKAELNTKVNEILSVTWNIRDGQVVPKTEDVTLKNGAVRLEAAYLYADLADSTTLSRDFDRRAAARVVRSYLHVMSKLVRHYKGEILLSPASESQIGGVLLAGSGVHVLTWIATRAG